MPVVLRQASRSFALLGLILAGSTIGLLTRGGALDVLMALLVGNAALAAILQQTLP